MVNHGKRYRNLVENLDKNHLHTLAEARNSGKERYGKI